MQNNNNITDYKSVKKWLSKNKDNLEEIFLLLDDIEITPTTPTTTRNYNITKAPQIKPTLTQKDYIKINNRFSKWLLKVYCFELNIVQELLEYYYSNYYNDLFPNLAKEHIIHSKTKTIDKLYKQYQNNDTIVNPHIFDKLIKGLYIKNDLL